MNKALLIIICDFLLLSLLSLANFDKALEEREEAQAEQQVADRTTSQSDLMEALQAALEEERSSREELQAELQNSLEQMRTQEEALQRREQDLAMLEQDLMTTEERAALLEQERLALDAQVTDTVRNLIELEEQLNVAEVTTEVNNARLSAMQAELLARERVAQELKEELEAVEEQQRMTEQEKQQLALNLKEVETERNVVREQLTVTRQQMEQVQQEKAQVQEHATKLAEGVGALAEKSDQLQAEIRESRPLTGNEIFSGFISNRVETEFTARRTGFLGPSGDTKRTQSVLVSSGGKIYALYHSQNTLLDLKSGQTNWEYVYAHIRKGFELISMDKVKFLQSDPRVVLSEISPEQAKQVGVKIYPLTEEPYKFSEAVLVGGSGDYYGESPFQIDARAPKYVKMDKGQFRKFFGNFAPSRGDIVFSKTGKVLGIMVNNEYCLLLDNLTIAGEVGLGTGIQSEASGRTLSNMSFRVGNLPEQVR